MAEFTLTCRYENKKFEKIITAKNDKEYYKKHCPRNNHLFKSGRLAHHEMLDQLERDILFMDRTGFVASRHQSPLHGLNHQYKGTKSYYEDWRKYPYDVGFDHTTAWRRVGEKWPILVITEPYYFGRTEIGRWQEIYLNGVYKWFSIKPSKNSLWNDSCYLNFWWCPKFYDPEWDK